MARLAGWLVLVAGLAVALGLWALVYALATMTAALAFALPVALVALVAGGALVQSGRMLTRSGATRERTTHDQALLELAAHRGPVTAGEAARALGISPVEADAILTDLAKREPDRVVLDVSDEGVIRFRAVNALAVPADVHLRVAPGAPRGAGVRVENIGDLDAEGEGSSLAEDAADRPARLR
ncbi:MAG: hypothetical protein M3O36_04665 [Myxococcota bacterium]|nr:hypothetical protein [Myxococcota bacterium]